MLQKIKNIALKARNVVKIGMVIMAVIKTIEFFADEIEKIDSSNKTTENE